MWTQTQDTTTAKHQQLLVLSDRWRRDKNYCRLLVWLTLSTLTSCQRFPRQKPGLHVEIAAALQILLEVDLLGFALQHLGLNTVG